MVILNVSSGSNCFKKITPIQFYKVKSYGLLHILNACLNSFREPESVERHTSSILLESFNVLNNEQQIGCSCEISIERLSRENQELRRKIENVENENSSLWAALNQVKENITWLYYNKQQVNGLSTDYGEWCQNWCLGLKQLQWNTCNCILTNCLASLIVQVVKTQSHFLFFFKQWSTIWLQAYKIICWSFYWDTITTMEVSKNHI